MKNTMKKMMAAMLSMAMMLLTAGNALAANAEEYTGKGDPKDAVYMNTVTIETVTLTESQAKDYIVGNADGNYVEINVNIGSEGEHSFINATGLSYYYDSRMYPLVTRKGGMTWGNDYGFMLVETQIDARGTHNGLFVTACIGEEGIEVTDSIYSFRFQLPDNVKAGDTFPVEIIYNSGDKFTYGKGVYDNEMADQAWTFTNGIINGGVEVVADPVIPENVEVRGDYEFIKPEVNNVVPETIGNINGDTSLDSSDASIVLGSYAAYQQGTLKLTDEQMQQADFNNDNTFDSSDAALILSWYANAQSGK